ncbi:MAG: phosphatidate cytidylyltransferase [Defluviitaleaceae bacterium]|nr:phosphatidate cytidylyltransferase [Defluviitaleaceae bacterium]
MKQRILVGVLLLVILSTVLFFGGIFLRAFLALVSLMAMNELSKAFKVERSYFTSILTFIFTIAYFIFFITNTQYLLPLIISWLLLNMIYMTIKNEHPNKMLLNFFLPIYIVLPFSFVYLVSLHGLLVLLVFTTSWGTDTFAYFIGKFLGKRKLTKISPSKTIAGAIGGIVGGTATSIIVWQFVYDITFLPVLMFLFVSVLSEIGDLAASVIKRHLEIKDYSALMPGHGGILDRFDSVLFTAPLVYFALEFIL